MRLQGVARFSGFTAQFSRTPAAVNDGRLLGELWERGRKAADLAAVTAVRVAAAHAVVGTWAETMDGIAGEGGGTQSPLSKQQRAGRADAISRHRAGRERRAVAARARQRRAGNAPQRLRLPPQSGQQLPARADRSLRARHDDREVPPPRRGDDHRHGAAGPPAARPAAEGDHRRRRHDAGGLSQRQDVRSAHADQPGKLAEAGNRPAAADHAGDGPAHAAGQGAAGPDRRPAAHRQDDPAAAHQPGDCAELSGRVSDHAAGRRAARRSDRHAPHASRAR